MSIRFETEKDMEDAICAAITRDGVCPISGELVNVMYRQPTIPGYGRPDVVKVTYWRGGGSIAIMELKNEPVQPDHLNQVSRYMTGLRRALERLGIDISVAGQVVGTDLNRDYCWLFQECSIEVYTLGIDFDRGIDVRQVEGWHKTNEQPTKLNDLIRECIEARRAFDARVAQSDRRKLELVRVKNDS